MRELDAVMGCVNFPTPPNEEGRGYEPNADWESERARAGDIGEKPLVPACFLGYA